MENKNQKTVLANGASVGVAAPSNAPLDDVPDHLLWGADALSLEPNQQAPVVPLENQQGPEKKSFWRIAKVALFLLFMFALAGVAGFTLISGRDKNADAAFSISKPTVTDKYDTIKLSLESLLTASDKTLSGDAQVTINGAILLNNNLLVAPSIQPTGAKPGQIYYDKATNQLAYYNGQEFVFLTAAGPTGLQELGQRLALLENNLDEGVLSVQGQTGDVNFVAGPGMLINGTTFSNSGVLAITSGSPNVSVTNNGNGNYSIGMTLGSGTITSSGGTNGAIPLYTGSQNIEDSIITQSGLAITIAGSLNLNTALAVANGGTGATDAASARTNLGLTAGGAGDIWVQRGGDTMTGPLVLSSDPTQALQAATKQYVDAATTGSQPGITWTAQTGIANAWQSVTYGNELFVAVSSSGTGNRVMTSPDGINWTGRTSAANNDWKSVTYGNGLFVAVSQDGTNNRVMTSPDGINWTSRTTNNNNWRSVTYGNGQFVAVAWSGTGNRVMTSPDGITWTTQSSASDSVWQSVTYGNGLFVATGSSGAVMTSPDGIAWTSQTAAASNTWQSVTYGNGLFVAVSWDGTNNRVMTSPDGIAWTIRVPAADYRWNTVTYGNGLFVAVSFEAGALSGKVMTSPDGIAWTLRTSPAAEDYLGVTYGNGVFVAVAFNGTGRVMTSGKMGVYSAPTNNIYQGGMSIFGNVGIGTSAPAYGLDVQAGGVNVANNVTVGGTISVPTLIGITAITPSAPLTVGATNQPLTLQGSASSVFAATDSGNTISLGFVTPGANVSYRLQTAAAGIYDICTTAGNCLGGGGAGGANSALSNLASVAINTSLLTGNSTVDLGSATSPFRDLYLGGTATNNIRFTGTSSAPRTITIPDADGRLAVSASGNIALSLAGDISFTGQLPFANGGTNASTAAGARDNLGVVEQPGLTWTSRTSAGDYAWESAAYGNGIFVALTPSSTANQVMTSPDGINWTLRPSAANKQWKSIVYGNGLFVAVAQVSSGDKIMTSPDGINWTLRTTPAANNWRSVTYGNGKFVAVSYTGTGNRVMTSPDGITWTTQSSASDSIWQCVTYGNGMYVAVGSGGAVMTSPDGITWTTRTATATNTWQSVVYGNGLFVAVANSGTGNRVMTSPDGITWAPHAGAADNNWDEIVYGNGLFVAVPYGGGANNNAMTSPDGINWTLRTLPATHSWLGLAYGNGVFVATAADGTGNRVASSGISSTNTPSANNIYQGGMTVYGNVGLGNASPTQPLHVSASAPSGADRAIIKVDGLLTDAANVQSGIYSAPNITLGSASTKEYIGLKGAPYAWLASNRYNSATLTGNYGTVYVQGDSGQILGNAYGLHTQLFTASSGITVTNAIGAYLQNPDVSGGGAITNAYGLSVENHTQGTNSNANITIGGVPASGNYSIYNASTYANYFAGSFLQQNASNSTTAFQIQDSAGTGNLLIADTTNLILKVGTSGSPTQASTRLFVTTAEFSGALRVGDATHNAQFDGTSHELTFNGNARHTRTIMLSAEYAGAVLDAGSGANNNGTMTSGLDLTNRKNYYKWSTAQATSQDYDVVVQIPIPSDFSAWASTTPLTVDANTGDTTNGTVQLEVRDSSGTVETNNNFLGITPSSTNTWEVRTCGTFSGTYTAGDYMTVRLRLASTSAVTNGVKIGNIKLSYLSKW